MKLQALKFSVILLFFGITSTTHGQISTDDLQQLVGTWKLDMTPNDTSDNNYASMLITEITPSTVKGEFYRTSVSIREGRVNTQSGLIYVALVSSDNSGDYNTSFYYKDGTLFGSTHSLDRDFLAVWTATKIK